MKPKKPRELWPEQPHCNVVAGKIPLLSANPVSLHCRLVYVLVVVVVVRMIVELGSALPAPKDPLAFFEQFVPLLTFVSLAQLSFVALPLASVALPLASTVCSRRPPLRNVVVVVVVVVFANVACIGAAPVP